MNKVTFFDCAVGMTIISVFSLIATHISLITKNPMEVPLIADVALGIAISITVLLWGLTLSHRAGRPLRFYNQKKQHYLLTTSTLFNIFACGLVFGFWISQLPRFEDFALFTDVTPKLLFFLTSALSGIAWTIIIVYVFPGRESSMRVIQSSKW